MFLLSSRREILRAATFLLLAVLLAPVAFGQAYATLTGVVRDSSRAVVPAAILTLSRVEQNRTWQTRSNALGAFAFGQIPPGSYRLEVEAPGFKNLVRNGLVLQVAQAAEVDVTLELGAVSDSVEVTAETPLLETASSTLGEVVNAITTENLPLNGRNVLQLVALTPGINTTQRYRTAATGSGNLFAVAFAANGGRNVTNMVLLDGSPQEVMGYNVPAYIPSPDALQEFKVQTNALSAEYGRTAGAVVNMVHRSGASQFHGVAYEFLRNDVLDANGFFNNRNGQGKAAFRYNQFGFALGGPLTPSRETTFFFVNYEGIRQVDPASSTFTVPEARMKSGDFSQISNIIHDPLSINSQGRRLPFPGNRIPAGRLNPVGVSLVSHFPDPNRPGVVNNFFSQAGSRTVSENFTAKVDRRISQRQNFFGRFSWSPLDTSMADPFHGPASPTQGTTGYHSVSTTIDETYMLGGWLLHGNYGLAFHADPRQALRNDIRPSSFGFPAYLDPVVQFGIFPRVQPDGYAAMGADSWFLCDNRFETHTWTGDAAKLIGAHSIKFGGSFRLNRVSNFRPVFPGGQYVFNEEWTRETFDQGGGGDSIASMLLGFPSSGQVRQEPALSSQIRYGALYLQDDWRFNTRLTLNLGLRWEADWPLTERYDRASWFDLHAPLPLEVSGMGPFRGGLVFAGSRTPGAPRGIKDLDWNNFGPRAGLAYKLTRGIVVRSGFGMYFHPATAFGDAKNTGALGFNAITPMTTSIDGGRTPYTGLSDPFPDGFTSPENGQNGLLTFAGQSIMANLRYDETPYSMQWNFDVQYELPGDLLLDVAYAGSAGVKLPANANLNQLPDEFLALGPELSRKVRNPFFGILPAATSLGKQTTTYGQLLRPFPWLTDVTHQWGSQAHSTYHALQTKFRKRYKNGLQFLAAYTWSKMLDDVSSVCVFCGQQNPGYTNHNRKDLDKSLSALDVPHHLALNYQGELPFGPRKRWLSGGNWISQVAGGWIVNGITTIQSGLPVSINSAANTTSSYGGGQRPNNTGRSSRTPGSDKQRIDGWFNPGAFIDPPLYTFGNVSRFLPDNRGPRLQNWDLSVLKNIPVTERFRLQFRAEFFNLFNQVNLQPPATTFGRPQYGLVTASEPARIVQFGLKLHY